MAQVLCKTKESMSRPVLNLKDYGGTEHAMPRIMLLY